MRDNSTPQVVDHVSRHQAERIMTTTTKTPRAESLSLLHLPAEVRHQIYEHVPCHRPSPLSLASEAHQLSWSQDDAAVEPTFYTELFRVNKAIT
jgi:hypothetical protein